MIALIEGALILSRIAGELTALIAAKAAVERCSAAARPGAISQLPAELRSFHIERFAASASFSRAAWSGSVFGAPAVAAAPMSINVFGELL